MIKSFARYLLKSGQISNILFSLFSVPSCSARFVHIVVFDVTVFHQIPRHNNLPKISIKFPKAKTERTKGLKEIKEVKRTENAATRRKRDHCSIVHAVPLAGCGGAA